MQITEFKTDYKTFTNENGKWIDCTITFKDDIILETTYSNNNFKIKIPFSWSDRTLTMEQWNLLTKTLEKVKKESEESYK